MFFTAKYFSAFFLVFREIVAKTYHKLIIRKPIAMFFVAENNSFSRLNSHFLTPISSNSLSLVLCNFSADS